MYFKFKVALGRTISVAALPKAPNLLVLLALLASYGPTVLRDPSPHYLLKSYALASANTTLVGGGETNQWPVAKMVGRAGGILLI